MAASPTPSPAGAERLTRFPSLARAFGAAREAQGLGAAAAHHPLAVAFSGGADSTALLRLACALAPGRVQAFHIHHGLQDAADDFERHCASLCDAWRVPLRVIRVQARHAPGESPEDAARRARYAALAQAAREQGAWRIWLGQHADDQAETLLLALSRGAGLPGLAAMPARFEREGVVFERPLLAVPGAELRAWLQAEGIAWVEDPTNQEVAFTRNRIRHQLLPALEAAFPQFRETFARSARHAAQAQVLLSQVAEGDLAAARMAVVDKNPDGEEGAQTVRGSAREENLDLGLSLPALQALSRERQANLLRHWLRAVHRTAASAAQLEELLDQVADCRTRGHHIRLRVGAGHVERTGPALAFRADGASD